MITDEFRQILIHQYADNPNCSMTERMQAHSILLLQELLIEIVATKLVIMKNNERGGL